VRSIHVSAIKSRILLLPENLTCMLKLLRNASIESRPSSTRRDQGGRPSFAPWTSARRSLQRILDKDTGLWRIPHSSTDISLTARSIIYRADHRVAINTFSGGTIQMFLSSVATINSGWVTNWENSLYHTYSFDHQRCIVYLIQKREAARGKPSYGSHLHLPIAFQSPSEDSQLRLAKQSVTEP
jgi:hypothetical protein